MDGCSRPMLRLVKTPALWSGRRLAFVSVTSTPSSSSSRQYSFLAKTEKKKEKVVILGSGWAGYALARTLDPRKFERIIVSPRSHFVFTPLLAGAAVGTLEFRAVLEPVRRLRGGVDFRQGWADDIDVGRKVVYVEASKGDDASSTAGVLAAQHRGPVTEVRYDKLVVAVGAYSQTFGIEGVKAHAHFLRDVGDARRIRLRVLSLFERCASPTSGAGLSDADRRALLHFAVVGGGPTGIEFAAELHDLIHEDLARMYPQLIPLVRITVYDVAPKVLPMFDQQLARYAMEIFDRQGIEVKTEHHLEAIRAVEGRDDGLLKLKVKENPGEEVGAGLVVWSTGLMQNPLVERLIKKEFRLPIGDGRASGRLHLLKDAKTGSIVTDDFLRARIGASPTTPSAESSTTTTNVTASPDSSTTPTQVLPDVFIIGDCASMTSNPTLPKTAQVASQQAVHLGKQLNKGVLDPEATTSASTSAVTTPNAKPFKFRNFGTMTYLGGWKAIHQSKADELRGWAAWVLWRTAYLTKSMSVRNKIMVPFYWAISWIFGRDISRF